MTENAHSVVDAQRAVSVASKLSGQGRGDPGGNDHDIGLQVTVRPGPNQPPAPIVVAEGLLHLAAPEKLTPRSSSTAAARLGIGSWN